MFDLILPLLFLLLSLISYQMAVWAYFITNSIEILWYTIQFDNLKHFTLLITISLTSKILTITQQDIPTTILIILLLFWKQFINFIPKTKKYSKIQQQQQQQHHSILIGNLKQKIQHKIRIDDLIQIFAISFIYSLINKNNYSIYLLNCAFLKFYEIHNLKLKILITIIKTLFSLYQFDLPAIITVCLLPNLLNDTLYLTIYSYFLTIEQYIFYLLALQYGIYHNLVVFLSYYIFYTHQSKYLIYLYIPLFVYAFESQSEIYIYSYAIMSIVYIALFSIDQDVKQLRLILIFIGLLISQKWYCKLLLLIFIIDKDLHMDLLLYYRCFSIQSIFNIYINYSYFIPIQLFQYKLNMENINYVEILVLISTITIQEFKKNKSIIQDRIVEYYLYTLPLWPIILYFYRNDSIIVSVIYNCIQICEQLFRQ